MKRPTRHPCVVYMPTRRLIAEYLYTPARKAARVGADSPKYPDAGARAIIRILHLYDDKRCEQTVSPHHLSAISEAIREGWLHGSAPARVEVRPAASPTHFDYTEARHTESPDQFPLPMEEGHLSRAMRRTES